MSSADTSESLTLPPTPTPTPTSATTPSVNSNKITRGHSCLTCQQRKVKCDGQRPCSTCNKNKVECIAKPPSAPRRRKPKDPTQKQDVLSRLKKLEHELRTKSEDGVTLQNSAPEPEIVKCTPDRSKSARKDNGGQIIIDGGHARYVENTMWAGLKNEFQGPKASAALKSPNGRHTSDGLIFGCTGRTVVDSNLTLTHPQPVHIFKLWQVYLDNVNPLVKIFHAPTMQQVILDAISQLDKIPEGIEALLFAIYLSAVVSLNEEDCQKIMGETRFALIGRFSQATELALSNARFLKSYDIVILQALTLFLLAMRHEYDPQSLWLLTGLAVRSGQRIGLHRENASQGFSLFDAELRRRLWWQILILDSIAAKLSGAAIHAASQFSSDTRKPLNVNDSDLWPTMKEMPKEHTGVTEMLLCSIRCEIGAFMHQSRWAGSCLNGQLPNEMQGNSSATEKDNGITELESMLEAKYLRYCDTSVSFHLLAFYLVKSAVAQMRLAAHHPYQYPDRGASLPQAEKDMLLSTSLDIIEYHNLAGSTKSLQGFLWHVNVIFSFEAMIFALGELSYRNEGELVDRARRLINEAYESHPELISDTDNALYFAMGNLAVRAWSRIPVEVDSTKREIQRPIPSFIMQLHAQRQGKANMSNKQRPSGTLTKSNELVDGQQYQDGQEGWTNVGTELNSTVFPGYAGMDSYMNPMDWEYWQALLDGREMLGLDSNL